MPELSDHFDQFLRERIYLHNVTPKTAEWYRSVWRIFATWWDRLPTEARSRTIISRADLQGFVVHLRERGVKPVSCNCYLRGINAFCRWLHQEGHSPNAVRLPPLKLEKRVLPIHDERRLRLILSYRPTTFAHWRAHAVACTILDTGCRIDELLTARVCDFDFDNLLLTVIGKGRKQRKVPISGELRKRRGIHRSDALRDRSQETKKGLLLSSIIAAVTRFTTPDSYLLKLQRAKEHRDAVDRLAAEHISARRNGGFIEGEIDADTGELRVYCPELGFNPSIFLAAADCLVNVRACIDHLVGQIAAVHGVDVAKQAFPIADRLDDFNDSIGKGVLKGVPFTKVLRRIISYVEESVLPPLKGFAERC